MKKLVTIIGLLSIGSTAYAGSDTAQLRKDILSTAMTCTSDDDRIQSAEILNLQTTGQSALYASVRVRYVTNDGQCISARKTIKVDDNGRAIGCEFPSAPSTKCESDQ